MSTETVETGGPASGGAPPPDAGPPVPAQPGGRPRRPPILPSGAAGTGLGLGIAMIFLSLMVFIPLGAVAWRSASEGPGTFWHAVRTPDAWAALELTVEASLIVAFVSMVMGTLVAWVLVRDNFPGKGLVDTLIDLPFALPTIVAGLVLLALYGTKSPLGIDIAYTRTAVVVALLFVTLPFVVRTVQPVLLELDRDMEEAAWSLGASPFMTFRRIILPNLTRAMAAGTALSFARSMAEFGSTVLISGNLPFETQVASVYIFGQIETDNPVGAAAVATVLLFVALVVVAALGLLQQWGARRG